MREVQIKELVKRIVRESFKQSISETSYNLGSEQYTKRNMTPVQILDLAMAYAKVPGKGNPMYGKKMPKMIAVANDLARLNGTIQLDAKTRSKEPALILSLLKNKLVSKEEYIELYKNLLQKQISVIGALKNSDPASRMVGGAAARQAHKDMKGEFEENVNEMSVNDIHFKEILRMYDHGGSFSKKKVAVVVCKNPRASRKDIIDAMLDMDYNEITDVQDELGIKESVNEGKPNYEVYHKTYTSAIQAALDYAKKEGYDYDVEETAREIGMGPRKPSEGKTNKFHLSLTKNFKEQKKMLHIQVYGMKNSYELNAYIQ